MKKKTSLVKAKTSPIVAKLSTGQSLALFNQQIASFAAGSGSTPTKAKKIKLTRAQHAGIRAARREVSLSSLRSSKHPLGVKELAFNADRKPTLLRSMTQLRAPSRIAPVASATGSTWRKPRRSPRHKRIYPSRGKGKRVANWTHGKKRSRPR